MQRRPAQLWTALAAAVVLVGSFALAGSSDAAEQPPAATMATVAYPAPGGDAPNPDRGPMRFYETAVGGGGRTGDAIHSDARQVGTDEKFQFICH